MIPISDSVRSRTTPYVNVAFISINVLIFLYQLTLGTFPNPRDSFLSELDFFFLDWGSIPACLTDRFGFDPATDPRLLAFACPEGDRLLATPFTSILLHGGWLHLLGKMIFLWVFVDNVAHALGNARYAAFYSVVGLAAGSLFAMHTLTKVTAASGRNDEIDATVDRFLKSIAGARNPYGTGGNPDLVSGHNEIVEVLNNNYIQPQVQHRPKPFD